ncbi:heavy metal-associated domain-containing protein [Geothrix sp.]|jgi:copper chaperone CopZ|uniref:heavy-metal-associated domain-containing protein n=1 Tax=Geothrix sp. TaxID=1962974 RepID=UPI0025BFD077|nr:heavy metal-associated domain-containing protein [Geothrix sp.]
MSSSITLSVPTMTCGHCVSTIRKALLGLGLAEARIDLKAKEVRIAAPASAVPGVLAALSAEGYPATTL